MNRDRRTSACSRRARGTKLAGKMTALGRSHIERLPWRSRRRSPLKRKPLGGWLYKFGEHAPAIVVVLSLSTVACGRSSDPVRPMDRAAWIASAPDQVLYCDLLEGGKRLHEEPSKPAEGRRVDLKGVVPTFADDLREPTLWRAPTQEEMAIPFTVEWIFSRGKARFVLRFREPYEYAVETEPKPNPGPEPGVSKLAVIVDGRAWIGEIDVGHVFTPEVGREMLSRIGYVR